MRKPLISIVFAITLTVIMVASPMTIRNVAAQGASGNKFLAWKVTAIIIIIFHGTVSVNILT